MSNEPPDDLDAKECWDKYLRCLADLENMRKRHNVEIAVAREEGVSSALREILPVMDSLHRGNEAAQAARGRGSLNKIREGFGHVARQAQQTLSNIGVDKFDPKGDPFDHERMDAVAVTPPGEVQPGHVAGVVAPGYTRGGKILRPAIVAVAQENPDDETK